MSAGMMPTESLSHTDMPTRLSHADTPFAI